MAWRNHPKFEQAKLDLPAKFKFGMCERDFDFAGCHLKQTPDGIYVGQEDCANKWLEEMPLSKARKRELKSPFL